jgi:hypothetical protein
LFVEFEPKNEMDEFEQELRQALQRRPAPPGLKRRLLDKREAARHGRTTLPIESAIHSVWLRLAASVVLVAALGGGLVWRHNNEEQRKGEEARRQVLTAFRITGHALNRIDTRLAAHGHSAPN